MPPLGARRENDYDEQIPAEIGQILVGAQLLKKVNLMASDREPTSTDGSQAAAEPRAGNISSSPAAIVRKPSPS